MKNILAEFILICVFTGMPISKGTQVVDAATISDNSFHAYVSNIIDGDSIQVKSSGVLVDIRLWGIDAPEWDQPYSEQAKEYLQRNILNNFIRIQPYYKDIYKRLVAEVFIGDLNINESMVESGWAWVHIYFCDKPICKDWQREEDIAQKMRTGLWQDSYPVPPWKWKKRRNKK